MKKLAKLMVVICFLQFILFYSCSDEPDKHEVKHKAAVKADKHDVKKAAPDDHSASAKKPSPDEVIKMLQDGNERFYSGKAIYPHTAAERIALAGKENQGNHAYATVITCSDSRVPVELLFGGVKAKRGL
mgnify:CR=1 FL=1